MKVKYLLPFILVLSSTFNAQNLNSIWKSIDSLYKAGNYKEVTLKTPAFIDSLKKYNLDKNMLLPYVYLGESYCMLGDLNNFDSSFQKGLNIASQFHPSEVTENLKKKQCELYSLFIENMGMNNDSLKSILLNKIIVISKKYFLWDELIWADYELAKLQFTEQKLEESLRLLEESKSINDNMNIHDELTEEINTKLFEIYLKLNKYDQAYGFVDSSDIKTFEYVLAKYSDKLISEGNYSLADSVLFYLQKRVLTDDINFMLPLSKKRFSIYQNKGDIKQGIDTLRQIISVLDSMNTGENIKFELSKMLILAHLKTGNINYSKEILKKLENEIDSNSTAKDSLLNELNYLKGDIAYFSNNYEEAINYYSSSLNDSTTLYGMEMLSAQNNLGLVYYKTGRIEESISIFHKLSKMEKDSLQLKYRVNALLNLGILYNIKDEYDSALTAFRKALELSDDFDDLKVFAHLRLAETLELIGYKKASETHYAEVKKSLDKSFPPISKIEILRSLAQYKKNFGEYDKSTEQLNEAYKIAESSGLNKLKIKLVKELADLAFLQGEFEEAKTEFEAILAQEDSLTLENYLIRLKVIQCKANLGIMDNDITNVDSLLVILENNYSISLENPYYDYEYLTTISKSIIAFAKYAQAQDENDIDKIFEAYKLAKSVLSDNRNNFYKNLARTKFTTDAWTKSINSFNTFINICSDLYLSTGDVNYLQESFDAIEEFRAKTFITDVGEKIVLRMQSDSLNFFPQLNSQNLMAVNDYSINSNLTVGNSANFVRGINIVKDERNNFSKLQKKYETVLKNIENSDSKLNNVVSIDFLGLESAKDYLQNGQAILSYYVNKFYLYVYFITKENYQLVRKEIGRKEIDNLVEMLRTNVQNIKNKKYMEYSKKLFDILIRPFEEKITDKTLYVIPSATLHNVPYGVLYDGGKYLLELSDISYLPNLTSLQFLYRDRNKKSGNRILAVGNPSSPFAPSLLGTELEVKIIKELFPTANVLIGDNATETEIISQIGKYDIIHFACHGTYNQDMPLLSSLLLTPDSVNDGNLEVADIYSLNLINTSLVVMSACETGLSQIKKNDDMYGLVRGFLYAGAPNIISSLWKVDDEATYNLMKNFYYYVSSGLNYSSALRRAKLNLINDQKFSHPYYWSAFTFSGFNQ